MAGFKYQTQIIIDTGSTFGHKTNVSQGLTLSTASLVSLFCGFFPLIKFPSNRKLTFQRDSQFASFLLEILSLNVSLKVLAPLGCVLGQLIHGKDILCQARSDMFQGDLANIPLKVLGNFLTLIPRNVGSLNPNFYLAFNCLQYLTNTKSN